MEKIILVNSKDEEIGYGEKIDTHKSGRLHRAFSVFIFNSKGELLIQKRAKFKYHSAGLWANSCCSHQRENENLIEAVHRRLDEELGFDVDLREISKIHYNIKFDNELIENEIDHIFTGKFDGEVEVNKVEIEDFKWVSLEELEKDMKNNPKNYTYWFKLIFSKLHNSQGV